jgi:hypothetical protein
LWQLAEKLEAVRLGDTVPYLTLFLVVVFPYSWWPFSLASRLALLTVLLFPAAARSAVLWGILAVTATATVVHEWDLADNHKYLLCYWLWVMCVAHISSDQEFRDRIIRFNARFFLIFIFLGAALQKTFSPTYMSGALFETEFLFDPRFQAFAHLIGIDASLGQESAKRLMLLQNPYLNVIDNHIRLVTDEYLQLVAQAVTWYDLLIQVAIGGLLLFCRRNSDIVAHILLLFFIFTTYVAAPVLGFGITLCVMGFALAKERFQYVSWAYLVAFVAVLAYDIPWRSWVMGG